MGQLYTVYIKLNFDDKNAVNKALDDFFDKEPAFNSINKTYSEDDLYWRLCVLTCNVQNPNATFGEHLGHAQFTTTFHATYSWEGILSKAWHAIAPTLNTGSSIQVYPDNGVWTLCIDDKE